MDTLFLFGVMTIIAIGVLYVITLISKLVIIPVIELYWKNTDQKYRDKHKVES